MYLAGTKTIETVGKFVGLKKYVKTYILECKYDILSYLNGSEASESLSVAAYMTLLVLLLCYCCRYSHVASDTTLPAGQDTLSAATEVIAEL